MFSMLAHFFMVARRLQVENDLDYRDWVYALSLYESLLPKGGDAKDKDLGNRGRGDKDVRPRSSLHTDVRDVSTSDSLHIMITRSAEPALNTLGRWRGSAILTERIG
jgi:hypothetical protein